LVKLLSYKIPEPLSSLKTAGPTLPLETLHII